MDRRDKMDIALRELLLSRPIQVGMSDTPAVSPTVPYLILYQSPSPHPEGDFMNPESLRTWDYLVKSVGKDHRETAATQSWVREAIVGRDADGNYKKPLVANGFNIIERCTVSEGAILKSAGPNLFEVNDIYRLELE